MLFSSLARGPIVVPSPPTPPRLKRLNAQRDAFRQEPDRSLELLLARESKLVTKLNVVKAN